MYVCVRVCGRCARVWLVCACVYVQWCASVCASTVNGKSMWCCGGFSSPCSSSLLHCLLLTCVGLCWCTLLRLVRRLPWSKSSTPSQRCRLVPSTMCTYDGTGPTHTVFSLVPPSRGRWVRPSHPLPRRCASLALCVCVCVCVCGRRRRPARSEE